MYADDVTVYVSLSMVCAAAPSGRRPVDGGHLWSVGDGAVRATDPANPGVKLAGHHVSRRAGGRAPAPAAPPAAVLQPPRGVRGGPPRLLPVQRGLGSTPHAARHGWPVDLYRHVDTAAHYQSFFAADNALTRHFVYIHRRTWPRAGEFMRLFHYKPLR